MQSTLDTPTLTDTNSGSTTRALIFDSGVGALSVFAEINQLQPQLECILALDNARFPYGVIKEADLLERVAFVVNRLIEQYRPDLCVIACNTASTLVLDELRKRHAIPFVGVVPAIKPAAANSKTQTIGLLATPATVNRSYTNNLIQDFAPESEILRLGSSELVYMAERKLRGEPVDLVQLEEILTPFIEHPTLDTLVLACTHFPLLHDEIRQLIPERIAILDCGAAIAQRVRSLLPVAEDALSLTEDVLSLTKAQQSRNHRLLMTSEDMDIGAMRTYCSTLGIQSTEVFKC